MTIANIARLTAAAERLVAVLAAENAALAARDWQTVRRLAEAKRDAGDAWASAVTALLPADGSSRPSLPPALRQQLAGLSRRVEAAAEANERRLTVLMFAQRRIIEAIADAVASVGTGAATYAPTGAARPVARGARPALSLNRAI